MGCLSKQLLLQGWGLCAATGGYHLTLELSSLGRDTFIYALVIRKDDALGFGVSGKECRAKCTDDPECKVCTSSSSVLRVKSL
eukprot:4517154-Amphidinium_carterae.3